MTLETAAGTIQHSPDYLEFPGQGTQHPEMSDKLYNNFPQAQERIDDTDKILGYPLRKLTRDEGMLRRTRFTQPAIVSTSVISVELMEELGILNPDQVEMIAGHSIGLFSGLIHSGAMTYEAGMRLVDRRAVGMQHASDLRPGGMDSVLGITESEAREVCRKVPDLYVAVLNEGNSVVVGGTYKALEEGRAQYKKMNRVKARELPVDGPFHTPLMEPAAEMFARQLAKTEIKNPTRQLMANTSARLLETGADIRQELPAQLVSPVRWADIEDHLHAKGYTHSVEPSETAILSKMKERKRGGTVTAIAAGAGVAGAAITLGTAWLLRDHKHHE